MARARQVAQEWGGAVGKYQWMRRKQGSLSKEAMFAPHSLRDLAIIRERNSGLSGANMGL